MKKVLAREILIFLTSIVICFFCFIATFGYNLWKNSKIENLKNQIIFTKDKAEKLDNNFNYKERNHIWYYKAMVREMNSDQSGVIKTEGDFWNYTTGSKIFGNVDTVKARWNGKWNKNGLTGHFKNIGFLTPQKLNDFIIQKSMTSEDSLNHKKSIQVLKSLDGLHEQISDLDFSKLDSSEQIQFALQIFIILFGLLFICRYIFYLIRWCILTLKNN